VKPVRATPQSNHAIPDLPTLETDVTMSLGTIRIRCFSNDVRVGHPLAIIAIWVGRIWISDIDAGLHVEIVYEDPAGCQAITLFKGLEISYRSCTSEHL
jgi:hypothetical protein